nr:unnamed protein product [Digitaria exilis]
MEASSGTCEVARLPEEILSALLALTTPRDACRAAAADSDAVWSRFMPRDLSPLTDDSELSGGSASSEKGRFLRLCDRPVLLADGLTSMWLDREGGARCYMLSARQLNIAWGDTPHYWSWIPIQGSRKMLSRNSIYAAYMVFKVAEGAYGLCSPYPETSVTLGGSQSTRQVCFEEDGDHLLPVWMVMANRGGRDGIPQNVLLPRERVDGWMELEMGELQNDEGEDGEVSIKLMETSATVMSGLIVQGIEIRPKKRDH